MRRLPVYLLLDTSGSMRGNLIAAVNQGVQELVLALKRNPIALESVYLSVVTFDDEARQVVPLTDILGFQPPVMRVDQGLTALGQGLTLLGDRIEREVVKTTASTKGDWKPLVFIMTDGEPTDDWQTGIEHFRKVRTGAVVACAVGQDCDTYILKKITDNVVEIGKVDPGVLGNFFKWVSNSIEMSSQLVEMERRETCGLAEMAHIPEGIVKVLQPRHGSGGDDPYTPFKGVNAIRAVNKDKYGNPDGTQYDLAKNGAFKGHQIAVLHLFTGDGFDFQQPNAALSEKGFSVLRWKDNPPSAGDLDRALESACQLWVISDGAPKLCPDHIAVIRSFFNSGHGVYIWGDNDPFYADANRVASALFGGQLEGNVPGEQIIHAKTGNSRSGMVPTHMICTGLENLYEGHTIATVQENPHLQPIVFGSAGNVVVAAYDSYGKRALLDGGFTRLYHKWDTAGTGRYVKNAAAWLVNYERFGRSLFGK